MLFKKNQEIDFDGSVVLDLKSKDKFSAIKELVGRAEVFSKFEDSEEFLNAVFQREQEKTTGFGHGIAVAHGKIASIKKIKIALGVSKQGIVYHSSDGKPVYLLFLIASPPDKSKNYLKILSTLMQVMRDEKIRKKMFELSDVKEIESLLDTLFNASFVARETK